MLYKKIDATKILFTNIVYFAAILIIVFLAELCHTDYGGLAALLVVMLYAARPKDNLIIVRQYGQLAVLTVFAVILYSASLPRLLGALCAVILIGLYNGCEGKKASKLFYAFYPVHLIFLVFMATLI
jgi:hypothetical protein